MAQAKLTTSGSIVVQVEMLLEPKLSAPDVLFAADGGVDVVEADF